MKRAPIGFSVRLVIFPTLRLCWSDVLYMLQGQFVSSVLGAARAGLRVTNVSIILNVAMNSVLTEMGMTQF